MKRKIKNEDYFLKQIKKAVDSHSTIRGKSTSTANFNNIEFHIKTPISIIEKGIDIYFNNCSISGARIDLTLKVLSEKVSNIGLENCEILNDFFIKVDRADKVSHLRRMKVSIAK